MALVSKIRDKSGLIVFIVGLGLLLFIIPFDSIYSFFGGRGEQPIGEVFGKPIYNSEWEFNEKFSRIAGNYAMVDNGDEYRVRDERQFWNRMMLDTILKTEIGKIGLQVSSQEVRDYLILGDNPSPSIKSMFTEKNEQGQEIFYKDSVVSWYNRLVNNKNAATGDQKVQLNNDLYYNLELPLREERLIGKYTSMAKYAVVGTVEEAFKSQIQSNAKVVADIIAVEANTVPDSLVDVSESDLKNYYEAHKEDAMWKISEDVAKFDFILIDIEPTQEDVDAMMNKMGGEIKKNFVTAKNDTAFINLKSDTKVGDAFNGQGVLDVLSSAEFDRYQTPFDEAANDMIESAQKGEVVGPFSYVTEGQTKVVLAKIRDTYSRNETEVRHILVSTQGLSDAQKSAKKSLADSIAAQIKADNGKFAMLGGLFSEDPGFVSNKGYYNVYPEAGLVPEFKSFALDNPIGAIGVVETQFGYHVMEVVQRGEFTHNYVAYIEKNVVPTEDTKYNIKEQKGYGFMEAASADYEKALETFGFESQTSMLFLAEPIDYTFGYNEQLVNWLFAEGRQAGDVSVPFETRDGKFIVAKLNGLGNYGVPNYEIIKEDMKNELLKERKLAYLKSKVNGAGSLTEAQEKLNATTGITEKTLTLDMNSLPGYGQDVKAIAKIFMIGNLNELTVVEGNQGVYVVVVKEKTITPAPADRTDAIAKVTSDRQAYVDRTLNSALLKMADVRDWRMKAQVYEANFDR